MESLFVPFEDNNNYIGYNIESFDKLLKEEVEPKLKIFEQWYRLSPVSMDSDIKSKIILSSIIPFSEFVKKKRGK